MLHAHTLFNRYYARTKRETIFKIRVNKTTNIDSYHEEGLEIGHLLQKNFSNSYFELFSLNDSSLYKLYSLLNCRSFCRHATLLQLPGDAKNGCVADYKLYVALENVSYAIQTQREDNRHSRRWISLKTLRIAPCTHFVQQ